MSLTTLNRLEEGDNLVRPDQCTACENEWKFGGWHIHHGWAHCAHCGMLYCIVDYDDDEDYNGPEPCYTEEFTEAISEFHDRYKTAINNDERFETFLEENHPELIKDDS